MDNCELCNKLREKAKSDLKKHGINWTPSMDKFELHTLENYHYMHQKLTEVRGQLREEFETEA